MTPKQIDKFEKLYDAFLRDCDRVLMVIRNKNLKGDALDVADFLSENNWLVEHYTIPYWTINFRGTKSWPNMVVVVGTYFLDVCDAETFEFPIELLAFGDEDIKNYINVKYDLWRKNQEEIEANYKKEQEEKELQELKRLMEKYKDKI